MRRDQERNSLATRREFLERTSRLAAATGTAFVATTASDQRLVGAPISSPVVDTHMHVWAKDTRRFPFAHPYLADFKQAPHQAPVEMLIDDMDQHGCTHAVLVQVIYHGWDNAYVADCVKRYPKRLKAHGLIDPTDPNVSDKLEFWMKEHGLHGMRFSAIYYQDGRHGGDAWIDAAETHRLWKKAAELDAVFNFFIAPKQLPKLENMVRAHPRVRVIVDHFSQLDLGGSQPERDIRLLLRMAKYPNVWVKVSELSSVSKSGKYPFSDAYPFVKRVYEAFGADQLLFGTGYPGAARAGYQRPTLEQEIALIRTGFPFLSDRARDKILGGNAKKLWGFEV